jgi:hypothetical protein
MPKIIQLTDRDLDELHREVERYLRVVEAFRAEGRGPSFAEDEWLLRLGHAADV